ncbi:MAG TPA: hypothetical protein VMD08_15655 [Candidatus Baltobacteraceae bacterium]|nr:hypothetical protein [Candidatus Baltobacteraceae bacterium]
MVLDSQEQQSTATLHIENNIFIHDKFAELVSRPKELLDLLYAGFGLDGLDGALK